MYACVKCEFEAQSKTNLENHMSKHNQNKCTVCGTCFWSESQLETHIKENHNDDECQADHMKSHEQNNCEKCSEIFISKEQLESRLPSEAKVNLEG